MAASPALAALVTHSSHKYLPGASAPRQSRGRSNGGIEPGSYSQETAGRQRSQSEIPQRPVQFRANPGAPKERNTEDKVGLN